MLKSLELFGFKSFADRTVFEFASGMTCVVGPNGSGKSNVVDSIKWILGDQSAKSLRGTEMTDVIFNGSNGRKPSGFSEATLTFDNSGGLLPIDATEVQVGRRLYRSGDSEYLLNKNVVRLKDIKDLFLGTGAGTAAYSIIEQGRVDQILQSNPAARRMVFEEAAGIARFKAKRVEAQKKIERIDQNLQRLTDIVDEVEAQLNSTRSQASKAAKYREISSELKVLWTGLAADDARIWVNQLTELRQSEELARTEAEGLESRVQELEVSVARADEDLQVIESRVRDLERQSSGNRESIAAQEATIRHQTFRLRELHADLDRLRKQRLESAARAGAAARELEETAHRLAQFEAGVIERQHSIIGHDQELVVLRTELDAARGRIRKKRQERDQLTLRTQTAQTQIASLEMQHQAAIDSLARTRGRIDQRLAELASAQTELDQRKQAHAVADSTSQRAREELDLLRSERSSLLGEHSQTEKRLAELRERRSATLARLGVLQDLERKQEGIGVGVREILRRAETLSDPPWSNILGTVGDLLDTALESAPLVEVALGDRTQLLVVDDLRPLLDYLNRGDGHLLDRVGFIELRAAQAARRSRIPSTPHWLEVYDLDCRDWPDLSGEPGVIQAASELVTETTKVPGLAQRLLADTWVVSTLDRAIQLAATVGQGCRFVTLQGELVNADGVLFVGTSPQETAVLSRKSELRKLRSEVVRLERAIEADVDRLAMLSKALESRTGRQDEIELEYQHRSSQVAEAALRLNAQMEEVARIELALKEQEQIAAEQEQKALSIESDLQSTRTRQETEQHEAEEMTRAVQSGETEMTEVEAALNEVQQLIRSEQLELAKHEERLKSLTETQKRLKSDQIQRVEQEAEANERYDSLLTAQSESMLLLLRTEATVAERYLTQEQLQGQLRVENQVRDEFRLERTRQSKELDELHKRRRSAVEKAHETSMKIREIEQKRTVLAQRIDEEYQLSLDDLVTSGVSAYRDYLRERYGAPDVSSPMSSSPLHPGEGLGVREADQSDPVSESLDNAPDEPTSTPTDRGEPTFEEVRPEFEANVDRLRKRLKMMGHVNTDALASLEEIENRFNDLSAQLNDLKEAKAALEDIIRRINVESKRLFLETFETIRQNFTILFRKLFGGGEGNIILENTDDVLECGIDIVARPPGKELRSLTLLSGGEKTMTAVGLLFAMFKSKPSPYCILDEVDAALDDANVGRYANVVKEFAAMTQFVVITHRKPTMAQADVLYGITMEQAGVSKRMAVKFDQVGDNCEILNTAKAA
jgi:chromosome segregation protein